jgi:hypothetical protein
MNKINFYDKERHLIMSFSNFYLIDKELDNIGFTINLLFGFFEVSVKTEIYIAYLQHFADELKLLCDNILDKKQAKFIPIERDVDLLFESGGFGHISVRIRLYYSNINHDANGILECDYTIDQSFLPELIDEIETMIKEMEITN